MSREWNSNLEELSNLIRFQDMLQNVFRQVAKGMVVPTGAPTALGNDSLAATLDPYIKYIQGMSYLFNYSTTSISTTTTTTTTAQSSLRGAYNSMKIRRKSSALTVGSWSNIFPSSILGDPLLKVESPWNNSLFSSFLSGEIWSPSRSRTSTNGGGSGGVFRASKTTQRQGDVLVDRETVIAAKSSGAFNSSDACELVHSMSALAAKSTLEQAPTDATFESTAGTAATTAVKAPHTTTATTTTAALTTPTATAVPVAAAAAAAEGRKRAWIRSVIDKVRYRLAMALLPNAFKRQAQAHNYLSESNLSVNSSTLKP